jgi:Tol biopolymer transport system component
LSQVRPSRGNAFLVGIVTAIASAAALSAAGVSARGLPASYALPSWSADGTQLFFASAKGPRGAIHAAGADGGRMRRLFRTGILSEVAWSPRDDWVAYSSRGRVVIVQPGGGGRRVVGSGVDVAWSPDGSKLAFAGSAVGGPIDVVDAVGSGRVRVTQGRFDHSPAWSPDASRIAFARSFSVSGPGYVYVARADGSAVERLGPQGAAPAWSPDGTRLAFWQRTAEGVTLSVYSFADAQVRVLTRTLPAFSRAPRWSPDGRRLLITVCSAFGACRIEIAAADGSEVTRVVAGADPAWSPDGSRIAFSARASCLGWGIYVVRAEGGAQRRITACR